MTGSNVQAAYTQWSATYDTDRNLTRDLDQVVTRRVLGERRFGSIVELGCGTGKNTQLFAQLADHVHALDFSEGMLAQARAKALGSNVRFSVADLTQPWPCADHAADLVAGNLVLEHIADLDVIFAEAARVLARPGQLFLSELHPFKQYMGSKAVFQHNEARVELPAFVHHISDFLSSAASAGFSLVELGEWWHPEDQQTPPRLVSFLFAR